VKVLITGASGFLGRPLVESLLKLGFELLVISRTNSYSQEMGQINWLQADLSLNLYQDKVRQFAPQIVIHLAWQDIPDFSFEKSRLNLQQSLEFIRFVSKLKSCKKILFSGSCLEYGNVVGKCDENKVIKESKNHFVLAKNTLLKEVKTICGNESVCFAWFRIFYVYGPRQRSKSLIPSILNELKEFRLPEIKSPFNSNDYIYVDDVVDVFVKATLNDFSSGIFNIGSGVSTSVVEICRLAEKIVLNSSFLSDKIEAEIFLEKSKVNFWASTIKVNKYFNWSPKIGLVDGIKKTWASLK